MMKKRNYNLFLLNVVMVFIPNVHSRSGIDYRDYKQACLPNIKCDPSAMYRTPNGICNNLDNSRWGSAFLPYRRYLPSAYEDGIGIVRGEGRTSSAPLPTPREVSIALSKAPEKPNTSNLSLMSMQWGQFLDHDMTITPKFQILNCCENGTPPIIRGPDCRPLDVTGDAFYSSFGVQCLNFVRSLNANLLCQNSGPSREQLNGITAFIDGSQVYGSTLMDQIFLRSFVGGQLRIGPGEEIKTGTCCANSPLSFLPITDSFFTNEAFIAGDRRVQGNAGLTSLHTLFVRAHNDIASRLSVIYGPYTKDETLFQETRRIIVAILQQITFGEFLPSMLGSTTMNQYDLSPRPLGSNVYSSSYDPSIDPSIPNVFATAAYRFGHTLVNDNYVLDSKIIPLVETFDVHDVTLNSGTYPSDFLKATSLALSNEMDHFLVETLTNKLSAPGPDFTHGNDLFATNVMRGRDHGLPPYNEWRDLCNLSTVDTFEQLATVMPAQTAMQFEKVYGSVDDIDLYPAILAESSVQTDGGVVGPTLACLLGKCFYSVKFGDRYFYESESQPKPFTIDQLTVIHQTSLAHLICAYSDTPNIQKQVMKVVGTENAIESCDTILSGTVLDQVKVFV